MVGAVHRQCRQHKWMGRRQWKLSVNHHCRQLKWTNKLQWMSKRQWRLSFSRAEILLINSWMPEQQIVYHMLRVFTKTGLFLNIRPECCMINNYHIKTLMLWACEMKSWTDDLNLIRICVELLNTASAWLSDARCMHYFISKCNLIDNSLGVDIVAKLLNSVDKTWLSTWFVNNYIQKCSMLCPDSFKFVQ